MFLRPALCKSCERRCEGPSAADSGGPLFTKSAQSPRSLRPEARPIAAALRRTGGRVRARRAQLTGATRALHQKAARDLVDQTAWNAHGVATCGLALRIGELPTERDDNVRHTFTNTRARLSWTVRYKRHISTRVGCRHAMRRAADVVAGGDISDHPGFWRDARTGLDRVVRARGATRRAAKPTFATFACRAFRASPCASGSLR